MTEPQKSASASADVRIPPPLLYIVPLALTPWLESRWPLPLFPEAWHTAANVIGVSLAVIGIFCMASALIRFRKAGTSPIPIKPAAALVITGPYRRTRNPMYLGWTILYLGGILLTRSWWAVIFLPLVLWVMNAYVIAREERYLTAAFGDEYRAYQGKVRRWI